ncbi:aspartate kinase [Candidatus Peregrinibacteria bacterium]|nr:aspartate kinase [Candidatus Peregrinibacteria bacterium]
MSIILKFGGTSVANTTAINQVVGIIRRTLPKNPVVITSALAHVTNLLLSIAEFRQKVAVEKILRDLKKRHWEVLRSFKPHIQAKIEPLLTEEFLELERLAARLLQKSNVTKKDLDLLASFGERFSSWLLTGALLSQKIPAQRVDSRELVVTDSNFGAAEVDFEKTRRNFARKISPLLRRKIIPVITGFIGRNHKGNTTTLGRGGSDYSAAITAVCLHAKEIQIWKDIPGFMTADPRVVKTARIIPQLSFQEAAELSYFGAKLLHPKTIHPAVAQNIPVRILNTFAPDNPGTIIYGKSSLRQAQADKSLPVMAIAYKKGITIMNISSLRMLGPYGFLEELFRIFAAHRVPIDVVATSEVSVSMTIEDKTYNAGLIGALQKIGMVEVRHGHVILSLVGTGLKNDPRVEAHIFEVFRLAKIPTEMISKGASSINFTCIIEEKFCEKAVRALHSKFF